MNTLNDNFIANMYGPHFLILYAGFIILIILLFRTCIYFFDLTVEKDAPRIPSDIDPYETAYLRGGSVEMIKIALCSLAKRGYLTISDDLKMAEVASKPPPLINLLPIEKEVFNTIKPSMYIKTLMAHTALNYKINTQAKNSKFLRENNFFIDDSLSTDWARFAKAVGIILIISLGLYKLIVALEKGRQNIFFLIVFAIIGSIIVASHNVPRITRKGKAFLKNLQSAFSRASYSNPSQLNPYNQILLASIFGFALLELPEYEFIKSYERSLLPPANSGGDSGSSSSCSSSCGGGCGGGCGGCG